MAFCSYQINTKAQFQRFPSFSCSFIAAKCCWLCHLMKVPKVKCRKKGAGNYFWRRFLLCCVYLRLQKHSTISVCIRSLFFIFCVLIKLFFFQPPLPLFLFYAAKEESYLIILFKYLLSDCFWSRTSKRHPRLGDIKARRFVVLLAAVDFHINLGRGYTLHCRRLLITGYASKTLAYRIC